MMNTPKNISVSMIGTLPPLKALSAYCLELVKGLDNRISLDFFSFSSIYPSFVHPAKENANDHSYPKIKFSNTRVKRYLTWSNPFTWIKAALENKSDIFHIQWWSFPIGPVVILMALVCKFRKIPIVTTIHNISSHETSFLFVFFSKRIFALSDRFIVHSHKNKTNLKDNYNIEPDQIHIIPHGPLNFFKPDNFNEKHSTTLFQKKYKIAPEEKILLLFGAIRPYKNLELILNALNYIADHIKVKLVIAGSLWEDWEKYETIIQENNLNGLIIKELNYIPSKDVAMFFAASDLVLIPYNHFNSQSGVGAAALSFEKPMIVSDCGGLPDLVQDEFCILKEQNPRELAEKAVKILSDARYHKKLSNDSKTIKASISWENISNKTVALYKKILKMNE